MIVDNVPAVVNLDGNRLQATGTDPWSLLKCARVGRDLELESNYEKRI